MAQQRGSPSSPGTTSNPAERFPLDFGRIDTSATLPSPPRYVIGQFASCGKVTTLAALGGSGKTMLALQMAVKITLGENLGNLTLEEGAAMLWLGEEDKDECERRIKAILDGRSIEHRSKVGDRLRAFPLAGMDMKLTRLDGGNVRQTDLVNTMVERATQLSEACGIAVRLIVIDHLRLAMSGDEKAADVATELTSALTTIAQATDAAVMLLAHSPKASIQSKGNERDSGMEDVAGSGAFVNNARSAEILATMNDADAKKYGVSVDVRKSYVKLSVVKNNNGPTGNEYWFKRVHMPDYAVAVLEPVTLTAPEKTGGVNTDLRKRIIDVIAQGNGEITENKLKPMATKTGRLKASQSEMFDTLADLIREGLIRKEKISQSNKGSRNVRVGTEVLATPAKV